VADFIGSSNLLEGSCDGSHEIKIGRTRLVMDDMPQNLSSGSAVTVSVRPEDILVLPGIEKADNRLYGTVSFIRDVGSSVEIYLDCDGVQIVSQSTPKSRPQVRRGDEVTAVLPPAACVVLKS
jgi:putative spermidine/putrescine transport system ATP-binding protein